MKNLQIGDNDLIGSRFNGHDLHNYLNEAGIESYHLVLKKYSVDKNTLEIVNKIKNSGHINQIENYIEKKYSTHGLFHTSSYEILFNHYFHNSDIVHYHLIHNNFFNISHLPILTKLKPSIWTLHDPWAITGHCIHPFDCNRWIDGCGDCPYLNTNFPLVDDTTALNWEIKNIFYKSSNLDIIVASKWMFDLAKRSPLLSNFKIHLVPFGINLGKFRPMDKNEAKSNLDIPKDSVVIGFRAVHSDFKGFDNIYRCIKNLNTKKPLCLLSFNEKTKMDEFKNKYMVKDLGWVYDENLLINAYNAIDIFLMPSDAEAFGMMAMEAMACGTPVIAFSNTALEETIFAPKGGIVVPKGDIAEMTKVLERLIQNPDERHGIGITARNLAIENYDYKKYVKQIIKIYEEVIDRNKPTARIRYIISQLEKINSNNISKKSNDSYEFSKIDEKSMSDQSTQIEFLDMAIKFYEFKAIKFFFSKIFMPMYKIILNFIRKVLM